MRSDSGLYLEQRLKQEEEMGEAVFNVNFKLDEDMKIVLPSSKELSPPKRAVTKIMPSNKAKSRGIFIPLIFIASNSWTEDEDKKLFTLYKQKGPLWSQISKCFEGKSEKQIKNRFYSTLRRIARKKITDRKKDDLFSLIKANMIDYVNEALDHGHNCFSRRGRPRKTGTLKNSMKEIIVEKEDQRQVANFAQDKAPSLTDTAESVREEEGPEFTINLNDGVKGLLSRNQRMIHMLLTEQCTGDQ